MASPTNLTDRITVLRDRPPPDRRPPGPEPPPGRHPAAEPAAHGERPLAIDYFMVFVMALMGLTVLAQLFLIVWLEIV